MSIDTKNTVIYNNKDPRFGFMIMDSDEYNTPIQPFKIKEKCYKKNAYNPKFLRDCRSQRYENCTSSPYISPDTYAKCEIEATNFDSIAKSIDDKEFVPKELNKNSYYDRTRLSKRHNPDLIVDRSPDTNFLIESFDTKTYDESFGKACDKLIDNCSDWTGLIYICCICICIICICCIASSSTLYIQTVIDPF